MEELKEKLFEEWKSNVDSMIMCDVNDDLQGKEKIISQNIKLTVKINNISKRIELNKKLKKIKNG